ncbi:MAG TPA: MFS transporter [Aeromicrobium sp.]|nr:MFS transporter [Aeromicrobium sp.]
MTEAGSGRPGRLLLAFAVVAIAFAAADTYVVVLALPEMMTAVGLDIDQLQRAAPIISGFLLGYVGVLPLIGRIADLRGRVPVLLGCLLIFAVGSVITAAAYDLPAVVAGRLIQGVGGGGLIPPTLALVADLWPPERRGLPLGIVGAMQELGSVLGPLYGAAVLTAASWRAIFWINAVVGVLLAAGMYRRRRRLDVLGLLLLALVLAGTSLVMLAPRRLVTGVTTGLAYLPISGESRWLTPLALATAGLLALFCLRQLLARHPLLDWRSWPTLAHQADLLGAVLLSVGLGAVIVTFASAEPESAAISRAAPVLLPIAGAALLLFWIRQRMARNPLLPHGAFARRPAWGALVVSFLIGASLIAALVDIPFFARLTIYRDSQVDAAMVLVRFLIALPVGALIGGALLRFLRPAFLTAVGMLMSAAAFVHMSTWSQEALRHDVELGALVAAGLGFGLAIAPVNAALLNHTDDDVHGVASGMLIVARMVGMLLGISALTTVGLRAFYRASAAIRPIEELCGAPIACSAYRDAIRDAGIAQLHAVFVGAAVCAAAAGLLAIILLRPVRA